MSSNQRPPVATPRFVKFAPFIGVLIGVAYVIGIYKLGYNPFPPLTNPAGPNIVLFIMGWTAIAVVFFFTVGIPWMAVEDEKRAARANGGIRRRT